MTDHADTFRHYVAQMAAWGNSRRDAKRLARLVTLCESLPQAELARAGERHLAWRVRRKTFAYYLNSHHDDGRICICCKSSPERQRALIARDATLFYVPAYLGARGWVSLRLDQARVPWEDVMELMVDAYRRSAPRRLAAEME